MGGHILVIDQGTTSTRAIVFDERAKLFTWCKVDQQPPGETAPEIPLSAGCRT